MIAKHKSPLMGLLAGALFLLVSGLVESAHAQSDCETDEDQLRALWEFVDGRCDSPEPASALTALPVGVAWPYGFWLVLQEADVKHVMDGPSAQALKRIMGVFEVDVRSCEVHETHLEQLYDLSDSGLSWSPENPLRCNP